MRMPPRSVRRIVGPAVIFLAGVGGVLLLPVLAVTAAVASVWLPGRWRGLRLLGFVLVWLAVEMVALAAALALWVGSGFGLLLRTRVFRRAHYAVLRLVLDTVVDAAQVLFRLRLETDGVSWSPVDDGVPGSENAMLVLSRHAGPGDSVLLLHTLMNRDHRRQPRIVLKDTLQLDPMIDVYLHRLPARFIDPTPTVGDDAEAIIGTLAGGMGEEDALLIFPEGGNFSPKRRLRAILRLRQRGHAAHADAAERMWHVLPPRPGGVIAAIEAAPYVDVVFVAHTGLEHLCTVADIWRELPVDKTLHLRWWFVPAADVPAGHAAQIVWLYERWADIDGWIAATKAP
ncbi:MAG: 1-acyl-sn-glycerol-3-phosphate acyltransferase [Geodermatophilaceae bacterium]|nr:1-acyl-sn-glycerol-3-phosphate acyltransferase [Geodermatophilaceae bacterium]